MTQEQIKQKAKKIAGVPYGDYYKQRLMAATQMADWLLTNLWISVEDELPELNEDVVIAYTYFGELDYAFSHRTESESVLTGDYGFTVYDKRQKITHWMPIPPLKGGNEK